MLLSILSLIVTVMSDWSEQAQSNNCIDSDTGGSIEFITRQEWVARQPKEVEYMEMPVPHIFIHHTAGPECSDFQDCAKTVRGIQNFHMDDRGWGDIGYNFLIGGDGRVYVGRGWDRVGAHTYGFNRIAVAFSLLGNFMEKLPNPTMLHTTKMLIQYAKDKGYVAPNGTIHGHRDAGCTDCPGDMLYKEIRNWPDFVGGPLPGFKCWKPPSNKK